MSGHNVYYVLLVRNEEKRLKKKNYVKLIVVAVTASMGLAVGTFAWQSISQKQVNEKRGTAGPGARVHDDFNGENKDVYVENYTETDGGAKVYVRVRLDEYMEVGNDAGITEDADHQPLENRDAVSLIEGADIQQTNTWRTRLPDDTEDTNPFMKYWIWGYGGATIYMPTFNKNKDSLTVDVNGTYQGDGTGVPYNDYDTYTLGQSVEDTAYYDADSDSIDEQPGSPGNGGDLDKNYTAEKETHYALSTATASVVTMETWKKAGMPIGDFWVWDSDGWFYYAKAVAPETATGLLLDSVNIKNYPEGDYYYAINVIGECATAYDWGDEASGSGFYKNNITEDALALLNQAASVVTGKDGISYLDCGYNTYKKIDLNGQLSSLICAGMDGLIGTEDDKTNVIQLESDLCVSIVGKEYNFGHLFLAPDTTTGAYRAMGTDKKLGTSDDEKLWYTGAQSDFPDATKGEISLVGATDVIVTTKGNATTIYANESVQFYADVQLKGISINFQSVTWSVSGNTSSGTYMDSSGVLYVGADETAGKNLTITAVSNEDNRVSGNYTITVEGPDAMVLSQEKLEANPGETVNFTGVVKKGNDIYTSQRIIWTVIGKSDSQTTINNGILMIGENEPRGKTLTIKAVSANDSSVYKTATLTIPIYTINDNGTKTLRIDGIDFYVLQVKNNQMFLLSKDIVTKMPFSDSDDCRWINSNVRNYLNGEWLAGHPTLANCAVETTIYTIQDYNNSTLDETHDKVFLLSEADIFGSSGYVSVEDSHYTLGNQIDVTLVGGSWIALYEENSTHWWLRSPYYHSMYRVSGLAAVKDSGTHDYCRILENIGVRPALWISFN